MTAPYNELHIRLGDIVSNAHYFQKLAPMTAVVKADAYGLGMDKIAGALHKAGVKGFYVFTIDEAIALRKTLPEAEIYFFAGLRNDEDAKTSAKHKIIPVLNDMTELALWQKIKWQDKKPLYMHVDTGMNRLGLSVKDWQGFCEFYDSHKKDFSAPMILSHLACADDESHKQNKAQLDSAKALLQALPEASLSLSASNGALLGTRYHCDQLRIGVGLYGVTPPYSDVKLKQPLTWQTEILQLRDLQAGETIGYGATPIGTAHKVAIIACGYADGLRRNFTGKVYINGKACSVLGRISMDCSAVDISDMTAKVGDMAEIIGTHQSLQTLADSFATIPYEVLCGIGARVFRKYID